MTPSYIIVRVRSLLAIKIKKTTFYPFYFSITLPAEYTRNTKVIQTENIRYLMKNGISYFRKVTENPAQDGTF